VHSSVHFLYISGSPSPSSPDHKYCHARYINITFAVMEASAMTNANGAAGGAEITEAAEITEGAIVATAAAAAAAWVERADAHANAHAGTDGYVDDNLKFMTCFWMFYRRLHGHGLHYS
jgi:hypothetical protein